MIEPRKPSQHMVTILDMDTVEMGMTAHYHAQHPQHTETRIEVGFGPWGIVETPQGAFILCHEGVGAGPLSDDDTYAFDGYAHAEGTFGIMPILRANTPVHEVREWATDERVPLHEFVRSFGARLESNFENFEGAITRAGGCTVQA